MNRTNKRNAVLPVVPALVALVLATIAVIAATHGGQEKGIDAGQELAETAKTPGIPETPLELNSYDGWNWSICRAIENVTMSNSQTTIFNGQLVFPLQNSTHSILCIYSPIHDTLTICQTAPLPNSFWPKAIDDKLYVIKRLASFPTYNGTVYSTTDLQTWNVEASTEQCCLQSIAKHTPTGAIYTGGVYSTGRGTYTRIMKLSNGSLNVIWDGTIWGSDDGIEMEMFNSTMIVCFDTYKANAIYSTDPENSWTDSQNTTLFNWIHGVDIRDGDLWTAGCDDSATGNMGLAKWDGKTHTSYLLEKTCWRVCNGSVAVSEGRQSPEEDPEYPCSIYSYTTDGTLDCLTLQCSSRSIVRGMAYDPSGNRLFALFWIPPYGVFVLQGYPST